MKRVFVINPRAGGGASQRWLARLERYFHGQGVSFEALICGNREETSEATRRSLEAGADQIVSVGGDGTMNAVLQGFFDDEKLVRPQASLAVARVGTGSDYFRTVVGTTRRDWREIVLNPLVRHVDVGVLRRSGTPRAAPRYFLNMAGFGLSAQIVERKERLPRWFPRSLRYLAPTLASYWSARPWHVELQLDDLSVERELLSLIVGKGIFAGGGMRFGGHVALDDGWLEVTLFQPLALPQLILKTPRLYRGEFAGEPTIEKFRVRGLQLHAAPPMPAECDGDTWGIGQAEVAVLPQSLRVCFPRESSPASSA